MLVNRNKEYVQVRPCIVCQSDDSEVGNEFLLLALFPRKGYAQDFGGC